MSLDLNARLVKRIGDIEPEHWNALSDDANPFVCHAFLLALEQQGCLGRRVGWFPSHLVVEDGSGRLIGAMPMYLKANSFGEFVFDWSWAEAHERVGLPYYPKAVVAAPFTPASGPRLLVDPRVDRQTLAPLMIDAAIRSAGALNLSSVHWLFGSDVELASAPSLLARKGCQFHWENPGYRDFNDFLDTLSAKRRKEIKRERRRVAEAGVSVVRVSGREAKDTDWELFHRLYRRTFAKHGNYAALRLDFFRELGRTMGHQMLLLVASTQAREIGAALFFLGRDTLYGRYWGAFDDMPALHFEVCYYQGIDYCIEKQLKRFEPGAQGEHKVSRGFDPRATWSYHWISDPGLREAIARYLRREGADLEAYMQHLLAHSAYREPAPC
ncbi:MAG: GNAT family N-acetyltransferase [Methylotetracoccus sp.]|nr:GNAT family N-acetyltransferase [Methylotetracoccus sp.]